MPVLLICRKEEIFSEASKALKHLQHSDGTDLSSASAVNGAKKLKTSTADVNMPSFTDMMAYIQTKVCATHNSMIVNIVADMLFLVLSSSMWVSVAVE